MSQNTAPCSSGLNIEFPGFCIVRCEEKKLNQNCAQSEKSSNQFRCCECPERTKNVQRINNECEFWTCKLCASLNTAGKFKCVSCKYSKYEKEKKSKNYEAFGIRKFELNGGFKEEFDQERLEALKTNTSYLIKRKYFQDELEAEALREDVMRDILSDSDEVDESKRSSSEKMLKESLSIHSIPRENRKGPINCFKFISPDMVVRILHYLRTVDDLIRLNTVCKMWLQISVSAELWEVIYNDLYSAGSIRLSVIPEFPIYQNETVAEIREISTPTKAYTFVNLSPANHSHFNIKSTCCWDQTGEDRVNWYLAVKFGMLEKRYCESWSALKMFWIKTRNLMHDALQSKMIFASSKLDSDKIACVAENHHDVLYRCFKELARSNWVQFYESLKMEFGMVAERFAGSLYQFAQRLGLEDSAYVKDKWEDFSVGQVLNAVLSVWNVYQKWCEYVDERCEVLNEIIEQERHKGITTACMEGYHCTPFVRDAALLAFRNKFIMDIQVHSALSRVIQHSVTLMNMGDNNGLMQHFNQNDCFKGADVSENILFTEVELGEDNRALDFSLRNKHISCSEDESGTKHLHKHYYDWILERMEDRKPDYNDLKISPKEALKTKNCQELFLKVLDALKELDIPDDQVSSERQTQGLMRRYLLLPLLRWHDSTINVRQSVAPASSSLLMEDIDSGSRQRGRFKGKGRATALAEAAVRQCEGDSNASWTQLSKVFN